MRRILRPGRRILALDLHPQRYGYAVLETPSDLLDWGVRRRYREHEPRRGPSMYKALRSLLEVWQPSLVVIKEPTRHRKARMKKLLTGLLAEVRHCRIPIRRISERAIQATFGDGGCMTKYAMASGLLGLFPFLAFMLPPRRRIWESEHYRMSMFAAVALALAACVRSCTTNQSSRCVKHAEQKD